MFSITGLTPLEHFRLRVSHRPEIIEDEIFPGFSCFSVMKGVATSDTYSDAWAREARGIVFNKTTGAVVARPLHKFFNLNEREETQIQNLDWGRVKRVMEKRDGSMIHTVSDLGKVKTKKTLDSQQAIDAQKFLEADEKLNHLASSWALAGYTCIFEWTSPNSRVVVGYQKPELQLLHIRHNMTGRYSTAHQLLQTADAFEIPLVNEVKDFKSFEEMMEEAKTREGVEGWVIQFEDGEMVKVKTDWYMRLHRTMTYWRERDIAELILNEELDDFKAMLVKDGNDITPILEIEKKFASIMNVLISDVEIMAKSVAHLEPRYAYEQLQGHPICGLAMSRYRNHRIDYEKHFRQNLLKQHFGLEQLGSLTRVKENEEN